MSGRRRTGAAASALNLLTSLVLQKQQEDRARQQKADELAQEFKLDYVKEQIKLGALAYDPNTGRFTPQQPPGPPAGLEPSSYTDPATGVKYGRPSAPQSPDPFSVIKSLPLTPGKMTAEGQITDPLDLPLAFGGEQRPLRRDVQPTVTETTPRREMSALAASIVRDPTVLGRVPHITSIPGIAEQRPMLDALAASVKARPIAGMSGSGPYPVGTMLDESEASSLPEGTVVQDPDTGEQFEVRNGQLIPL